MNSTSLDPKRLGVLVEAFSRAFFGTPEDDDLVIRIGMTLKALPDDVVRELGEAVDVLGVLTKERLGGPGRPTA
ncbi:MAG: hypothetical protein ACRDP6_36620 [Actinoallomurus sp.]